MHDVSTGVQHNDQREGQAGKHDLPAEGYGRRRSERAQHQHQVLKNHLSILLTLGLTK